MKKIYKSCSVLFMSLSSFFIQAQCDVTISPSQPEICVGDTAQLSAQASIGSELQTTFASGNAQNGNMFDLVATDDIVIDSFDVHLEQDTDIEIYYKSGSYVGSEGNAGAWTLAGTATNVTAAGNGVPTTVPINVNLPMNNGDTYAFYITATNVSLEYTNGTTVGSLHSSTPHLEFYEGIGVGYAFGNTYSPRVWNGNIHYSTIDTPDYIWSTAETTPNIEVSPNDTTTYTVNVTYSNSGCTVSESVDVIVNPLPVVDANATEEQLCVGDSSILTGSGADTYAWDNGLTDGDTIVPSATSSYIVVGTDTNGCMDADTIAIEVNDLPNVVANASETEVCEDETVLLFGSGASNYTWSNNVTDSVSYQITATDTFYVTGTDTNGCQAMDSVVIEMVNCAGLKSYQKNHISIYPNPARDAFTFQTDQPGGNLKIVDTHGKVIAESEMLKNEHLIETAGWNNGIYILVYEVNNNVTHTKVKVMK